MAAVHCRRLEVDISAMYSTLQYNQTKVSSLSKLWAVGK